MATGDKIVNLDALKAVHDYTQGQVSDLKSALDDNLNIYYNGYDVESETTVVTKDDIAPGTTIRYFLTALSGKAGYIAVKDANGDNVLDPIGKTSSTGAVNDFSGTITLPVDYDHIVTVGNGNLALLKFTENFPTFEETAEYVGTARNLFDEARIFRGWRGVASANWRIDANANYFITEPIRVEPGTKIAINWYESTAYYGHLWLDQSLTIIAGTVMGLANKVMTVPSGAVYVILCGPVSAITTASITMDNASPVSLYEVSKIGAKLGGRWNLFDKTKAHSGYAFSSSGGESANASYYTSDFIPVPGGGVLYKNQTTTNVIGIGWYDANLNYLSASAGNTMSVAIPANAAYAVVSGAVSTIDTMEIWTDDWAYSITNQRVHIPSTYERHALKPFHMLDHGYTYSAFPGACMFNGDVVVAYRVSATHTTPTDTSKWGGIVFWSLSPDGVWTDHGLLDSSETTYTGELRDSNIVVTKDGQYMILSGFSTDENDAHENYVILVDSNYEIVNYYRDANPTKLFWGNTLITPNGYLLKAGYLGGKVGIFRSTAAFDDDVSEITFEEVQEFSVADYTLSETTLGYFNDTLVAISRNDGTSRISTISVTSNLEGTDGWSTPADIDQKVHAPVLLPHSTGDYLMFAGALYDSSSHRVPCAGLIDPTTKKAVACGIIDKDIDGYSGYCGIVPFGGDTYGAAYYEDRGVTALYYRQFNLRMVCPESIWLL